ncbi:Maf-like protein [Corynebacterium uropygiale]|uniref:Nucleoside triphosphate pyrophosphatase n=1 Tax=Corynebacterium uropygiale TaxID=1775911 RepID=A0A9X1U035_9CORY|nr:nucleoside triphosphate pyrophosphatase [Corynebacterium uropygiale]MCF4006033.1 Maf-like protein [Corynebacterium uropygiale]
MRLVLASGSPSRRAILRGAGVEPLVHPADVDEDAIRAACGPDAAPEDVVAALARAKSQAVAASYPEDVVIACDSMLLIDGELMGKPHTVEATVQRWRQQAGREAELLTAHCIGGPGGEGREGRAGGDGRAVIERVARTRLRFAQAHEEDILAYARTGEPLECAGAFTLEALGGWFVDRIEGDPSNVIGLSLPTVRAALYEMGLDVHPFWNLASTD